MTAALSDAERLYVGACKLYDVKPDGAVVIALRTKSSVIKPSEKWGESELLPLIDLLSTARPIEPLSPSSAREPATAAPTTSVEDGLTTSPQSTAAPAPTTAADEDAASSVPLMQLTARVFREAGRRMHELGLPPTVPQPPPPLEGLIDGSGSSSGGGAFMPREPSPSWITRIDLSGGKFGSNGAELIAQLLATNSTILDLNISNCRIGPRGFEAIARALVTNRTLMRLDMHGNNCYAEKAKLFARALLQGGHGLRFLDMNNCSMSFEGCSEITAAVEKLNERLAKLSMQPQPRIEWVYYGNYVREEVWNSITHGIGTLFAIIGTIVMLVAHRNRTWDRLVCASVFLFCMSFVYLASLFYHAFF